jgi:hypothetical protein|tara:strand:+ start:175 stop:357 length:183 start_codon:yes stop_codon:yes gene_type:complete
MKSLAQLAGTVGIIHAGEDIMLMSLGRWLEVDVWLLFLIGVVISTTVLTIVINKITKLVQ